MGYLTTLASWIKEIWAFITTDFAGWAMVALLFLTLIFDMKSRRKSVKITPHWTTVADRERYVLSVANTGAVGLNIKAFGHKKWSGECLEFPHQPVTLYQLFNPQYEEQFHFYNGETGEPHDIQEKDIYYVYVRIAGGKVFKKYLTFPPFAWIKYGGIRLKSWYTRISEKIRLPKNR